MKAGIPNYQYMKKLRSCAPNVQASQREILEDLKQLNHQEEKPLEVLPAKRARNTYKLDQEQTALDALTELITEKGPQQKAFSEFPKSLAPPPSFRCVFPFAVSVAKPPYSSAFRSSYHVLIAHNIDAKKKSLLNS